jgi:hypothetical protein
MKSPSNRITIPVTAAAILIAATICYALLFPSKSVGQAPTPTQVTVTNTPLPVTTYQFVGISSAPVVTDEWTVGGYNVLNSVCQAQYGQTSRACFTDEFLRSPVHLSPATYPEGISMAWINPAIVSTYYDTSQNRSHYVDFSGTNVNTSTPNCAQWTAATSSPPVVYDLVGLVVVLNVTWKKTNVISYVSTAPCQEVLPVACCAPYASGSALN